MASFSLMSISSSLLFGLMCRPCSIRFSQIPFALWSRKHTKSLFAAQYRILHFGQRYLHGSIRQISHIFLPLAPFFSLGGPFLALLFALFPPFSDSLSLLELLLELLLLELLCLRRRLRFFFLTIFLSFSSWVFRNFISSFVSSSF